MHENDSITVGGHHTTMPRTPELREEWMDDALCTQTDPEAFFPEKGGSTRAAKKICAECDVRERCLQFAMDGDERFGIWGGMSERERRKLRPASSILPPTPRGVQWTAEMDAQLRAMNSDSLTDVEIGRAFGVHGGTVGMHRRALGLSKVNSMGRPLS